ncbi:MAG TPA: hypothetical protein DEQ38_10500 [Elusimicrobia bacterium]|nr:MAG: hypothetical protein A2089_07780 [Elusimicrobia bacterium GWD2_63_28]HCC48526.1 hypothetical protein [Elusimicrobiota bacterium]
MNSANEEKIRKLLEAGLEACLKKLSSVSPGEWTLESVRVFDGEPAEAAQAGGAGQTAIVRVTVQGGPAFNTALLLARGDMTHLSGCFIDDQVPWDGDSGRHVVAMLELGNIVLNVLINSLLKALKKSSIPSVPAYLVAEPDALAEGLAGPAPFTLIAAVFTASRDGRAAKAQALAILPRTLSEEL